MSNRPSLALRFLLLGVGTFSGLGTLGCGPVTSSQRLVGVWVGHAETSAERAARQRIVAPGEAPPAAGASEQSTPAPGQDSEEATEIEAFDFQVRLELMPDGRAEMKITGGEDLTGAWRVLSSEAGEIRLMLAAYRPEGAADANAGATGVAGRQANQEQRRFLLEFVEGDKAFVLREEGADPRFGAVRFVRDGA